MPRLVRVASLNDMQPNSMSRIEVEGKQILLVNSEGSLFAIGAICTHAGWDLSEGTLKGEEVICAGHGAVWNLNTGQAKFARPLQPEPVYKVEVKDNDIFIELD